MPNKQPERRKYLVHLATCMWCSTTPPCVLASTHSSCVRLLQRQQDAAAAEAHLQERLAEAAAASKAALEQAEAAAAAKLKRQLKEAANASTLQLARASVLHNETQQQLLKQLTKKLDAEKQALKQQQLAEKQQLLAQIAMREQEILQLRSLAYGPHSMLSMPPPPPFTVPGFPQQHMPGMWPFGRPM